MSNVASALHAALTKAAADLADVELVTTAAGTEFRARGRTFAAVHGATAEFDLDPVVAHAARGTPDTAISKRGADWVAFSPADVDRFARDRAVAWLASAHRRARPAPR